MLYLLVLGIMIFVIDMASGFNTLYDCNWLDDCGCWDNSWAEG